MSQSFEFSDNTVKVMEGLQKVFGVNSNKEVLARALVLAQFAAEKADETDTVLLVGKDKPLSVNLKG